jgi:hypothetical protein
MADARHLVGLLETGDEIDPVIGTRMFRTRSSAELPRLAIVVAWAKAVGLLRVVHGRLVPVKKNQRLPDRPVDLWTAMLTAFDQLGPALCPPGWFAPSNTGPRMIRKNRSRSTSPKPTGTSPTSTAPTTKAAEGARNGRRADP